MTLDDHIAEMLAAGGTDALVGFILGLSGVTIGRWRAARGIPTLRHRNAHKRRRNQAIDRTRESAALSDRSAGQPKQWAGATSGPQAPGRPARLAPMTGRLEDGAGDRG